MRRKSFPQGARLAVAPFEHGKLAFSQRLGRTCVVAIFEPRTIVRSENNQCLLVQFKAVKRLQNLSDRPVKFHHHVAVKSLLTLATEFVGDKQRDMHHRMG